MNRNRYEVLIVGCGNIAGRFDTSRAPDLPPLSHAGAYTRHGGFALGACVDPDEQRRIEFVERWGVGRHAPDIDGLGAAPGTFDVISICSPTFLHAEHLSAAIALKPKVIFCEKPLTDSEATAVDLVERCSAASIALVVNYSRRWDPSVAELEHDLKSGRWGAVRSAVAHYNKGILNNGGHMIELLMRLLGPLKVASTACPTNDFWDADPTVAALLTARGGTIPVFLTPAHAKDYAFFELELVCENGVIRMLSGGLQWQVREATASAEFTGYRTLGAPVTCDGRYVESMALAVDQIHRYLDTSAPMDGSAEAALKVQSICLQIQRMALRQPGEANSKRGNP